MPFRAFAVSAEEIGEQVSVSLCVYLRELYVGDVNAASCRRGDVTAASCRRREGML